MTILVTGASGFTGAHLLRRLAADGHRVRALVRTVPAEPPDPAVEWFRGDITDAASVDRAVRGVRKIFHLAAVYRIAGVRDHVYHDVHVRGTGNILESAVRHDVERVVHCSTVGIHGHIEVPPADETYRFAPGDIYQVTKLLGEQAVWDCRARTGLAVSVVRPTPIYGPGDARLAKLFRIACRRRPVILGDGRILYHMVYVDDLVEGFVLAGEKDAAVGEAFILGGEERVTLLTLIERIRAAMGLEPSPVLRLPAAPFQWIGSACEAVCAPFGIEPPIYRRRVDFFTKSRSFDISKAKRLLGYRPKVELKDGLARTGHAYVESGLLRRSGEKL